MHTYLRLRTLLGTLATTVLAGGAVNCTPTGSVDRDGFNASYCTAGRGYDQLTGLTPKVPIDYIERRTGPGSAPGGPAEGEKCKGAKDKAACEAKITQLDPPAKFSSGQAGSFYFVYTRGDEVTAIGDTNALGTLLAPIDNPKEAALVASVSGHQLMCPDGENNARTVSGGVEIITRTGSGCGDDVTENRVFVATSGTLEVRDKATIKYGDNNCQVGRRPAGLVDGECIVHTSGPTPALGAYFASMARLEAASVSAFETLAAELVSHGAPAELVARARSAAADEVRHARMTSALATRFGGSAEPVAVTPTGARALLEIARENAVEGCVRETFGALVATYQAARATDVTVARAMRVIADDETGHAALAWDVARWIEPQLAPDDRAAITRARDAAVAELVEAARGAYGDDVHELAGVPRPGDAARLVEGARAALWAA